MKFDYDLIIIGAGSGGLVVASGASAIGARVMLIEKEKMGGDCLNYGCVPSKSFLKGAHLAKDIKNAGIFGIDATINGVDMGKLMDRVSKVIEEIAPHDSVERFQGLGVKVVLGEGKLVDKNHVKVGEEVFSTKNIVISTGSDAFIPGIKGLNETPYLTNKNIFSLREVPQHLIILGGGPIGLELGQGFRHLGSQVTIIDKNTSIFTKDEPEVGVLMEKVFKDDGIDLRLQAEILEVLYEEASHKITVVITENGVRKEIRGDQLLVSLGRAPATDGLNLKEAGVKVDKRGFVETNSKLQTTVKNIYACGDAAGPYQFTHMAGYQAGIVIRNAIFPSKANVNNDAVRWTTYTKPEVAHVGHTEETAKAAGKLKKVVMVDLETNDRAKAENDVCGFLKLVIDQKGVLIGASLVSEKAGEMLPIATMAISQKLKATAFLGFIFAYPTEAEIFKSASLVEYKAAVKPWQVDLARKLFLRR